MPRTADKTDIPRRLAEAGYGLFRQHGYNATGIQHITAVAGVPKGSFYNHFESKEAFAAQIIRNYAAWVDQTWDHCEGDAPASPLGAIRHVFGQFLVYQHQSGCQGCLVGNLAAEMAEASDACREALDTVMRRWRTRLAARIARAQQSGEVRQDIDALRLATFFWDAWEGAVLRAKVVHEVQPLHDVLGLMLDNFFLPPPRP